MALNKDASFKPIGRRVRMSPEERREQIATQAASLIARYGSYGVSMQSIADAVGLTLPGLYHYVKDRDELLTLVIERIYDQTMPSLESSAEQFRSERGLPADSALSLPWMMRHIVQSNAERSEMVTLFMRLAVEASDPQHPAHTYYQNRHHSVQSSMMQLSWHLPDAYKDSERLHDLIVASFCVMDGVQIQSLTNPTEGMLDLWDKAERILFPSPMWDDYR